MQKLIGRALLLAVVILVIGVVPTLAQSDDGRLDRPNGSVLVGVQNDVSLASGESADAVFVYKGNALIEGDAKALVAVDSDVTVSGPGASVEKVFVVGGTLTAENGGSIADGAYVDTVISGVPPDTLRDAKTDFAKAAGWIAAALAVILFFVFIGWLIAVLVSALLLVAFGTSQARRAAANIGGDTLKSLLVGLLMLIVPWIVIALLFVTVVGIPLAIGLTMLWLFAAFLGYLVVGLAIGQKLLSRSRTAARPYGAAFLGVIILMLLSWIPFVGLLVLWLGLGSVTLAAWRVMRSGGTPPAPVGYGGPWGSPYQVPPPVYAPPAYAPPPPPGYWPPQQGGPPASWPQG